MNHVSGEFHAISLIHTLYLAYLIYPMKNFIFLLIIAMSSNDWNLFLYHFTSNGMSPYLHNYVLVG